jgi:ADP-ribose pyrophosphatase
MEYGGVRQVRVPRGARRVFEGSLFEVFQWEATLFDGSSATHEMVRRPDTVVVIADNGNGELLVTEQEQPDVDKPFYDFPGGRVEAGESYELAARREFLEETGYRANALSRLFEFQASDRVDSRTYVFGARDIVKERDPQPDAGEQVSVAWLSLDVVKEWALVNHRLAIVPVLLARDLAELFERHWVNE